MCRRGRLVDLVQTGLGLAISKMDGQFAHSAGFRLVFPLVRFRVSFFLDDGLAFLGYRVR